MIEIDLSSRERKLVHQWIETMREAGEHWGDGAVVFTDEAIVEHKLEQDGPIRITRHHLALVIEWAESSHHNIAFTVDELRLIKKIKEALAENPPEKGAG